MTADPDVIALYVQRSGGHFQPRADTVLYWVPESHAVMMALCWSELESRPCDDLV